MGRPGPLRTVGGLLGVGAALVAGPAAAQLPSDWRPFVRLGYEARVELFMNPVIEQGRVADPGVRVRVAARQEVPAHGSGTVVTGDGLILTNHHVAQAVLGPRVVPRTDESTRRVSALERATPVDHGTMLVYEPDPQDPLRLPVLRYRARVLVTSRELDVAVLRIVAHADGRAFAPRDLAAAPLGNPYAIPMLETLHIAGYPRGGGLTLTPTTAQFSGYTRGAPDARDGSLKTVATVAGGNSGGSALYRGRLVSIPTAVSVTDDRGARFGYFHPVTWAAGPLARLALRDGATIPALEPGWLDSEHNTDVGRTHVFVGGRVRSALGAAPVAGARIVLHRPDRTFAQILTLDKELVHIQRVLAVRTLLADGEPEPEIARRLDLPVETIRQLAGAAADPPTRSDDARRVERGEFFYQAATSASDGFFFLTVPRGQTLRLIGRAPGLRDLDTTREMGRGLYHDLGAVVMLALPGLAPGGGLLWPGAPGRPEAPGSRTPWRPRAGGLPWAP